MKIKYVFKHDCIKILPNSDNKGGASREVDR